MFMMCCADTFFHYNRLLHLGWTMLPQWCVVPAPMKMPSKIYSFGISAISELDPLTSHRRRPSHVWWISPLALHLSHFCPFMVLLICILIRGCNILTDGCIRLLLFIFCLENHISMFWIILYIVESLSCNNCSNQKLHDLRIWQWCS